LNLCKGVELQSEIAHTLDVSVIGCGNCQWSRRNRPNGRVNAIGRFRPDLPKLELENSPLRRLVADLLLETSELKERSHYHPRGGGVSTSLRQFY